MNYKGLVISVSSRCLKLLWQSCLCLDSNENKQTCDSTRKRKPLSARIIKQLFLLLCTLVLGVEPTHCRFCLAPAAMAGMFAALPQPQPGATEGSRELGCLGWEEVWRTRMQHQPPPHRTIRQIIVIMLRDIFWIAHKFLWIKLP